MACIVTLTSSSSSAAALDVDADTQRNVLITSSAVHTRVEPLMILARVLHGAGMHVTVVLPEEAVRAAVSRPSHHSNPCPLSTPHYSPVLGRRPSGGARS